MREITDKKLKAMYIAVCGLMMFGWLMSFVFFIILPDTIPLHFNARAAGGYDNYGSKSHVLLGPVLSTFLGCFELFFAWISKKRNDKVGEWAALWCGILTLSFCILMYAFFDSLAFYQ